MTAGDTARLQVPVLGLYAEHDHGIPVEAVRAFEAEMEQAARAARSAHLSWHVTCFLQRHAAAHLQAAAAQDAWQKTLAWFRRYLVDG